jgi:iron complex outermembrane receptor protein
MDVRGSVSVPVVTDRLAVKLDAISRSEDGFVTDRTLRENVNNLDRQSIRGAALWRASAATSVYATVDYTWDKSNVNLPIPMQLIPGRTGQSRDDFTPRFGSERVADRSIPNLNEFAGGGASLEIAHDFGFATLTSISGYRSFDLELAGDLDGARDVALDFIQDLSQSQFSQELQLASNGGGRLKWVGGLFFFDETAEQGAQNTFQATNNDNRQEAESWAVFGEASFELLDTLTLSAGGRYTEDRKSMTGRAFNRLGPVNGFDRNDGALRFDYAARIDFSKFTPRVVLDWKPTEDVLVYGSWSEGYKAGVFSAGRPTTLAAALGTLPPETVRTYEIGAKTTLLDRRLVTNVSVFDSRYDDLQLSFLSGGVFFIAPAGAKIRGAEIEVTAQPTDGLLLYGTYGHLDAEITEVTINPANGLPVGGLFIGAPLKHVPKNMYKLGFDWSTPTGIGTFGVGGNYTRQSEIVRNNAVTPNIISPSVGVLDAQVYYETTDGRLRLTLGGRNLTDEVYWLQGVNVAGPARGAPPAAVPPLVNAARFYAPPVTWSLTARYQF